MQQKKLTLCLNYLHCYLVEEENHDDVFLKYKGKKIWPKRKKQQAIMMDTTTSLGVEIKGINVGQEVEIEIWDYDWLSSNDMLGVFRMLVERETGAYTTDMIQNTKETTMAKYTLEWEVY